MKNIFIKDRIKKYRELRGLSQNELAFITGISVSNISKYETGNRVPKTDYLVKISEALNVPLSALISSSDLGERAFEELLLELDCTFQSYIDTVCSNPGGDAEDYVDNSFLTYKGKDYPLTTDEYDKFREDVMTYTSFLLDKIIKKSTANLKDNS